MINLAGIIYPDSPVLNEEPVAILNEIEKASFYRLVLKKDRFHSTILCNYFGASKEQLPLILKGH
jgi:hypothetical protein